MPSPNQTRNATRSLVYFSIMYSNVRGQCDLRGFSNRGSFIMLIAWCQVHMLFRNWEWLNKIWEYRNKRCNFHYDFYVNHLGSFIWRWCILWLHILLLNATNIDAQISYRIMLNLQQLAISWIWTNHNALQYQLVMFSKQANSSCYMDYGTGTVPNCKIMVCSQIESFLAIASPKRSSM